MKDVEREAAMAQLKKVENLLKSTHEELEVLASILGSDGVECNGACRVDLRDIRAEMGDRPDSMIR